ncbi:hypothetical protein MKX03_018931 [Papaver bracteatum]|nr:hypothetical protein MKX03_018931 [Papaver bracteatum]
MKRLNSSDSLGGLISMCHSSAEEKKNNIYSRGFQSMLDGLDEDDIGEETGSHFGTEKKRRLNIDQVKALEKNFEVENKLEPERKVKLAQELGLQPRQVAIWFQNRRARWKTKQLERDYGVLKASYDALKLKFDAVQQDKEALLSEVRELKSKLPQEDETTESNPITTVKEEMLPMESEHKVDVNDHIHSMTTSLSMVGAGISSENIDPNHQNCYNDNSNCLVAGIALFRDGSSDSDSSAILNEDANAAANSSSSGVLQQQQNNCFQFSDSNREINSHQKPYHQQYQQFVRMEEHNFFGGAEETCNYFTDDQAPTLQWCYPDQWDS